MFFVLCGSYAVVVADNFIILSSSQQAPTAVAKPHCKDHCARSVYYTPLGLVPIVTMIRGMRLSRYVLWNSICFVVCSVNLKGRQEAHIVICLCLMYLRWKIAQEEF
uniref:Uncharacterized protein n=1 Tax=Opuntia streptacantha TaxID=393608 RepID=A0A7C9CQQ4_OPUST